MKKLFKVLGILAVVDVIDITAKACMLGWLKLAHPDAADDWCDGTSKGPFIMQIRPKMIDKCADLIIKFLS